MKKLLTLLIFSACAVLRADDWSDLLTLAEQAEFVAETNEQRATVSTADLYVELRLFQIEVNPAFMRSRLAGANTFLWYLWNDYEAAQGFEKLRIGARIQRLSR